MIPLDTGHCVFVVDDDHDTRVSLRDALECYGYSVSSSGNGRAALELLRAKKPIPSVIVLDLMMPVMSGWELIERLREDPVLSQIPIVVTSASENKNTVSNLEFLPKPLDVQSLKQALQKYCA